MKKIICVLFTVAILVNLFACSDIAQNSNQTLEPANETTEDTESEPETTEETTETQIEEIPAVSFVKQTIIFPVHENEKTQFNAHIYEIEPFEIYIELPDGWEIRNTDGKVFTFISVWSKLDIYNGAGEYVGIMGYEVYEPYEDAEDVPQAIYGFIANGNNYHFDVRESYNVVKETDYGTTATADVYYSANIVSNTEEKFNKGIVSYNRDLLVYIAIELVNDLVSEDEWLAIAESIEFKNLTNSK